MIAVACVRQGGELTLYSGKQKLVLSWRDLQAYEGARASRGHLLPRGRAVTFCPYCGQNLTIQRCPACGTELEIDWKFCITCGRGVAAS